MRQTIISKVDMQSIYNGCNYQIIVDVDFEFERVTQEVQPPATMGFMSGL